MTNFNMSVDLDLGAAAQRKGQGQPAAVLRFGHRHPARTGRRREPARWQATCLWPTRNIDEYGYVRFDVPWSLRMAYNFNYSKPGFKSNITQTMTLSG